jgi:hypothetical protein
MMYAAKTGKTPVKLIARVHASIENGRFVGIDVADWARQKLIDVIVSYPMFIAENLDGDIWQDNASSMIDLDKYRAYVRTAKTAPVIRMTNFEYIDAVDTIRKYNNGDPLTEKDRIASFNALGLPVFFEILPRFMSPEAYKRRAMELYQNGAEGISLWDTYSRVPNRLEWSMARTPGA